MSNLQDYRKVFQHYGWAGGHVLHLLCAAKYLLAWFTLRSSGQAWYYKTAYIGAILSYAIVCYKSLFEGPSQPVGDLSRRAMTDENVHYLFLAVFWWVSKPVPMSLIPFATFSLFHVLSFLRSNVLPHFFPPTPSATAGQPANQHPFLKKIQAWIKANYDSAMHVVAYAEVLIFIRIAFGALLFQNSLLAPIIYAHFLRIRYHQSPKFTQKAVHHISSLIDGYVRRPGNPPIVVTVWDKIQFLVTRWGGSVLAPQP
ncbi:hypothetical protein SCHPADRAFT_863320 [Schizopora paradoxa]|uniref:Endoplasmic reticulum protein n=1 Tax=Schizopora paradoxa TaxID=27342 RepID=A0A0H2STV3_9AGAM|nr:hypothetical protein SCHPADRAFT_863320 [Schizopora paradoxa]